MTIQDGIKALSELRTKRRPTEKSVINHNIRDKLNINSDEYAVIEICDRLYVKQKKYSAGDVSDRIGYDENAIKAFVKGLIEKGLLERVDGDSPRATDKWKKMFMVTEDEFEEFMASMKIGLRMIKWTGSKADSKNKYEKARKIYSAIYLLERKKCYFEYLSRHPRRDIMGAPVFLNVKTQRFAEPWEKYGKEDKPDLIPIPAGGLPKITLSRNDLFDM